MRKWDTYFLEMAKLVSSASKDPSTKVGAVLVDQYNRVISTGFNGYAQGVVDTYEDREEKLRRTIHAEENAVLFAQRDVRGCTLYTTHVPCAHCTAVLIQSKIANIVSISGHPSFTDRWIKDISSAERMLKEAGYSCHDLGESVVKWAKS